MSHERPDPAVRRFALVTIVLPAVVTTVGLVVQLASLPQAPARIPPFWDSSGAPSGWEPAWLPLALTIVLGFGLPAVFGLSSLPSLRRGDRSPTFRIFGAQALAISVLLTVVVTSLLLQSLGTATEAGNRLWHLLLAGLAAAVPAAALGWLLQPKGSPPMPAPAASAIDLAPGERAAWMRTTSLPIPAVAVITAAAVIMALKAGLTWALGDRAGSAALLTAIAVALLALLAATAAFHVRIDAHGLSVRSMLGVPRFHVALHEVDSVTVIDARSLGVPGSWGIRIRRDRTTIIMRPTMGIRVTRQDGRSLFLTVDDAATGAALLQALAAQAPRPTDNPSTHQ
ncbi:hypothetical protein CVV68_18155 [Arthrobacter livingstonensis]|uniref:DUF1648 domain-containing protein n=1 Tax=Arthrobacter livingstonensis TaxID=670078 RepID=A0A2V5L4J0_9MICC|nr:hypothetical protein [Arthrobacter livingstonensis]PYI65492.1 hypothetical protein CVV68_18155 [Arthrobacter livingstonensis]